MANYGCTHRQVAYSHCGEMSCRNYASKCPLHSPAGNPAATCNLERARALVGLSTEAREVVENAIALSPALEGTILLIAELCYRDGEAGAEL